MTLVEFDRRNEEMPVSEGGRCGDEAGRVGRAWLTSMATRIHGGGRGCGGQIVKPWTSVHLPITGPATTPTHCCSSGALATAHSELANKPGPPFLSTSSHALLAAASDWSAFTAHLGSWL